ncbi:glutamate-cysteine ligase family protein [Glutamicibacter sp. FR1]|uniref:glutamate-cysteine ligase family protein n=1 Tax=Glutamicibacter sp. FR1 TaxID=3393744 RepID=UPI0039AF0F4E
MLASQLEIVTGICASADEALEALVRRRTAIERICREHQVLPFASGTALQLPSATDFTTGQRYATIHEFVPGIAREHFINGLHIHVHIPDAAAGVRALNALRLVAADCGNWRELSHLERGTDGFRVMADGALPQVVCDRHSAGFCDSA